MSRRVLLIDTCNETCGVSIVVDGDVRATRDFAGGSTSSQIVDGVRRTLRETGLGLGDLDVVGVVAGPGSFTGVRTGLAAAKGLCEAAALRLIAVSRLAVLAQAVDLKDGIVALDAGRGKLYLREVRPGVEACEFLGTTEDLRLIANGRLLVVAESTLALSLAEFLPIFFPLHASNASAEVLRALAEGADDVASVEANYLVEQHECYFPSSSARVGVR